MPQAFFFLYHKKGLQPIPLESFVVSVYTSVGLQHLDGFDDALADLDSFLVLGNEVPVALGK